MIDSIDYYEQDGRLYCAIHNADDTRELACIMLADDDCDEETETAESDNG